MKKLLFDFYLFYFAHISNQQKMLAFFWRSLFTTMELHYIDKEVTGFFRDHFQS